MARFRRLARVVLNVSDVARSHAFYAALPGFATDGPDSFRIGVEGTALTLSHGAAPGLKRFGFSVESATDLSELIAAFDRHGVRWQPIEAGVRMIEPHSAAAVEFFVESHFEKVQACANALLGIGHLVVRSGTYRESVAFWRDVVGFRVSDEIDGRISFLRCYPNPLHHSLAIGKGVRPAFHHLNFRAGDSFDVAQAANTLAAAGVEIVCGPGRHTPTGSRYVYFLDPDGLTLEISAGTEYFPEEAPRRGRVLPDRPESFDTAGTPRDPRMYVAGEIEKAGAESG
jgi:2,3-dihydroxy-p-cumate/2,3-dihydroxybenzoate 3,4-dioxygenase